MTRTPQDWDRRYHQGDTPWDTGLVSSELARVLSEEKIPRGRALELGCGTGTNAVYLAQQGFDVTAVDVAGAAIEQARARAAEAGVQVEFLEDDVTDLRGVTGPFDFLFDRGCYHAVRRSNLAGLLRMLERLVRPGTIFLLLAGNANEQSDDGPPRVHEHEIRSELGGLFEIDWIREFRFQDRSEGPGPLGWSCLLRAR